MKTDQRNAIPVTITGEFTATFIVDSDEALLDWINNAPGNDYSLVLIKVGEYHAPKGLYVDCPQSGTRGVFGESGSILYFYTLDGIPIDAIHGNASEDEFYINVIVNCNDEGCFIDCWNMYYCHAIHGDFWRCKNLVNCVGITHYEDDEPIREIPLPGSWTVKSSL